MTKQNTTSSSSDEGDARFSRDRVIRLVNQIFYEGKYAAFEQLITLADGKLLRIIQYMAKGYPALAKDEISLQLLVRECGEHLFGLMQNECFKLSEAESYGLVAFTQTVTKNYLNNRKRSFEAQKREGTFVIVSDDQIPEDLRGGFDPRENIELGIRINNVLSKMKPVHVQVLLLDGAGYTSKEMAQMLGISADLVRYHLAKAREIFKKHWEVP